MPHVSTQETTQVIFTLNLITSVKIYFIYPCFVPFVVRSLKSANSVDTYVSKQKMIYAHAL